MTPRARQEGFTLLEILIAMSILAVGATSVLSIFVWAISFHTKRVEENRLVGLWNHALDHAAVAWHDFDPDSVGEGQSKLPKPIVVDLTDIEAARNDPDMMVVDAARKYPGFQYKITFEENDFAVAGSSVVVNIEIFGLSGRRDEAFSQKQFLTRYGAPVRERFKMPDLSKYASDIKQSSADSDRRGR